MTETGWCVHVWDGAESDFGSDGGGCLCGGAQEEVAGSGRGSGDWGGGRWVCRLPERGARRGRWKRVGGPATAPPGTEGMTPTRLGCWDIEQALWAHLWKEEEEEWSEESGQWIGEWLERETGGRWRSHGWSWRCAKGECQLPEVASSRFISLKQLYANPRPSNSECTVII